MGWPPFHQKNSKCTIFYLVLVFLAFADKVSASQTGQKGYTFANGGEDVLTQVIAPRVVDNQLVVSVASVVEFVIVHDKDLSHGWCGGQHQDCCDCYDSLFHRM